MMTEQQEKDLREIFDKLPVGMEGSEETGTIKLINFSLFRQVIDQMIYNSSYTKGYLDGYQTASKTSADIITEVFSKQ